MRGRPSAAASAQAASVWTSTPCTASTTTRAASATRSAARASLKKLAKPGVSMKLILVFCHSPKARLEERECLREISSSSKSVTVEPSSTSPSRLTAPAASSAAETSCVLPHPPWPTTATLRIAAASYTFIAVSLLPRDPQRGEPPWRTTDRTARRGPTWDPARGADHRPRPDGGASGSFRLGWGPENASNVDNYVCLRGSFDETVETWEPCSRASPPDRSGTAIGWLPHPSDRNANRVRRDRRRRRIALHESDEDVLIHSPDYIVVVSLLRARSRRLAVFLAISRR